MLATRGKDFKGLRCAVSGSGNVAQYTAEKINQLGGKVITLSDSNGTIVDEEGIDAEKLAYVMDLKNVQRGRIKEYAAKYPKAKYYEGKSVWDVIKDRASRSTWPSPPPPRTRSTKSTPRPWSRTAASASPKAPTCLPTWPPSRSTRSNNVLYGPAKAANAGGVATSGLEMAQSSQRFYWSREEVDQKLHGIMKNIHKQCLDAAEKYGSKGDYLMGANIAGFIKVAKAMLAYGIV